MNNAYDVFDDNNTKPKQDNKKIRLSKEEYGKMMKEKRKSLFAMANEQTLKAVESPESYLQYLRLQSTLDYTVTNTLLVMAQQPNATMLKDYTHWREMDKFVRKGEKGISILEPGNEYQRHDGTIGISYNPKTVFDISQLKDKHMTPLSPTQFSIKELVGAIVHRVDIKPKVVSEESELPKDVYFDREQNELFVKKGLEPETMLIGLIREYCHVECADQFNSRSEARFMAESAAYMIANKYGLTHYDKGFANNIYHHFEGKEQKDIKGELERIKSLKDRVSERMEHGIYVQQQNRQEKQTQRDSYSR